MFACFLQVTKSQKNDVSIERYSVEDDAIALSFVSSAKKEALPGMSSESELMVKYIESKCPLS